MGSAIYRPHVIAVKGNYDDINRLCTQIADRHGWGFANINLRTYYAEGAKTYGFEIVEQLGWKFPKHVVCPVAGGTLLPRIGRAFEELRTLGWADGDLPRIHAVQAAGSAPVVRAFHAGLDFPEPVKPDTIAKSIAIGNPADGHHVLETLRATGGSAAMVEDETILDTIKLLAETEGVFTEPAGGATLAGAIALIKNGTIPLTRRSSSASRATATRPPTSSTDTPRRPSTWKGLAEFEEYLKRSAGATKLRLRYWSS